jgi:hypothetical protein
MRRRLRSDVSVGFGSLRRLVGALIFALALLGLSAGTASGQPVQCGQVVTQAVTLDSDLTGCDTGLVVGADGITIDLNGHAIVGAGNRFFPAIGTTGIVNTGHSGVRIRDGTISGFLEAITLRGASDNRLGHLNVRAVFVSTIIASHAIEVSGGSGNWVEDSVIRSGPLGILLSQTTGNRILDNQLGAPPLVAPFFFPAVTVRLGNGANSTLIARNTRLPEPNLFFNVWIGFSGPASDNRVVANCELNAVFPDPSGGTGNIVAGNNTPACT